MPLSKGRTEAGREARAGERPSGGGKEGNKGLHYRRWGRGEQREMEDGEEASAGQRSGYMNWELGRRERERRGAKSGRGRKREKKK